MMKIKDYREAYKIKQKDLAKQLGICEVSYFRKEKGEYMFTIEEYRKLYKIFSKYNEIDAGKFFLEA